MKLNERAIQDVLYNWESTSGTRVMAPNLYLYAWESDFISVTKAGFVHEYEIKVTKGDFRADFKKADKHSGVVKGMMLDWNGASRDVARPNYFWYVCPENMIAVNEVPSYAGLIWVSEDERKIYDSRMQVLKAAPRLHGDKINDVQLNRIAISLRYKYWAIRSNGLAGNGDERIWKFLAVIMSAPLAESFVTAGSGIAAAKCVKGLPVDARLVYTEFRPETKTLAAVFEHESFKEFSWEGPALVAACAFMRDAWRDPEKVAQIKYEGN